VEFRLANLLAKNIDQYLFEPFPNDLFRYQLAEPIRNKTFVNEVPELVHAAKLFSCTSLEHPVICTYSSDPQDIIITNQFLKLVSDHIHDLPMRTLITAEILAKILAYRNLTENLSIEIPTDASTSPFVIDSYFDLWRGMPAFGLLPKKPGVAPILLFRGTVFSFSTKSGLASLLSDLDPRGPGHTVFLKAREEIRSWLSKVGKETKPRVIGHSLGGSLASYVAIYDHELLNTTSPSVIFNSPGVHKDLAQQWKNLSNPPALYSFVSRGDPISKLGHLFGDVDELSLSSPIPPFAAHTNLYFAEKTCFANQVDVDKENKTKLLYR
jgi:Lipase (class 3)